LNAELLDSKDSNHHGYIMIAKTANKMLVLHHLSFHSAPLGVNSELWHQKLFSFTGDVVGDQISQTMQLPAWALNILPRSVKVAKLAAQLASLQNNTVDTLGPVAIGVDKASFDEVIMRYSMHIPGKYLPLLIVCCLSPKEVLLTINTEAVTQNEQDKLVLLINWLRMVVTCSAAGPTVHFSMACSAMPRMPIMELLCLHGTLRSPANTGKGLLTSCFA
jgi:hypothetical protein